MRKNIKPSYIAFCNPGNFKTRKQWCQSILDLWPQSKPRRNNSKEMKTFVLYAAGDSEALGLHGHML